MREREEIRIFLIDRLEVIKDSDSIDEIPEIPRIHIIEISRKLLFIDCICELIESSDISRFAIFEIISDEITICFYDLDTEFLRIIMDDGAFHKAVDIRCASVMVACFDIRAEKSKCQEAFFFFFSWKSENRIIMKRNMMIVKIFDDGDFFSGSYLSISFIKHLIYSL
jgi:hypothetical protein